MNQLRFCLAAWLLCMSGWASAAVTVLQAEGYFNGVVDKDAYTFDIAADGLYSATLGFDAGAPVLAFFSIFEKLKESGWGLVVGEFGARSVTFSADAGKYKAVISSIGLPKSAVPYGFTVSAVPEPETWAMLLIGLGLIGFQANRKRLRV